ncbi:neurogenic locus Notch protein-like [Uloborus diversus]|uniref:neurogenic locus Notch protein-like n=1 Tax=Uloborus diversus TaxID=327109 RepID=UPI002409D951|nr:neurogenic locus Notch protein-like [Uloborus diversus]
MDAEYSYFVSFPLVRDKYISTQQSRRGGFNAETKETVDYGVVAKDVGDTMNFLFGQYYDTLKVFKCSDSPTQNLLRCQIEVQFHYDPKEQKKIIQDEGTCTSKEGNGTTCIIPPRLQLQKSLIRPDMITDANPCAPALKKIFCGPNAECSKVDNKTQNFVCTCSKGFRSYGIYYPFVDERTIVHRCEDIDECKEDPKACPDNTECTNQYGSHECKCVDGYQPSDVTKDPKFVGCSPICSSKTCNNGKCDVSGNQFYCKCDDGYIGKYCDKPMHAPPTAEAGSMKIALIILSTMIIPFILFSVYITIRYKTLKKSTSQSTYFDDQSSLTMNMMVPVDRREDDSDLPR